MKSVGLSGLRGWVKWVGLSVLGEVGWVGCNKSMKCVG